MRKWLVRLGVLAALVGAGVVLRYTVFAAEPVEVRVAHVERGRVEETVTNSQAGTVEARRRARISPERDGRVVEAPHEEGDRVEEGEVLLRVYDAPEQARLLAAQSRQEAAEARLLEAEVRAERAERELARNRELAKRDVISEDLLDALIAERDAAVAARELAAAEVRRAAADVGLAEVELAQTVVRAPFAGVVAELSAEVGEWITPSPPLVPVPEVIDLIDTTSIYVSAPMDEIDSARLRAGQPARVTVDSHPGRGFRGSVERVAAFVRDVEQQNRTVEVEVALANPTLAAALLPGTSADVEVVIDVREGVLRIPTPALLQGGRVLVLTDAGVLAERGVQVGLKNWDYTEVTSGLAPGERVVTSLGRPEVVPGARATTPDDGAPPAGEPPPGAGEVAGQP